MNLFEDIGTKETPRKASRKPGINPLTRRVGIYKQQMTKVTRRENRATSRIYVSPSNERRAALLATTVTSDASQNTCFISMFAYVCVCVCSVPIHARVDSKVYLAIPLIPSFFLSLSSSLRRNVRRGLPGLLTFYS